MTLCVHQCLKRYFRSTVILISLVSIPFTSSAKASELSTSTAKAPEAVPVKSIDIEKPTLKQYYPKKYPVSRWENLSTEPNFYKSPYQISIFSPKNGEDGDRLWSQTKSIFAYGFGVIGVIALLPEDISNWDKEDGIFNKWSVNVKNGPVWDRDSFQLNYLMHPYFGGVYYQVARKSGYRQWDAFVYSALMSTFYWEYGIEAFAELPSIQDLVVTPVLGWAYGEWAFSTEMSIRANNDLLWGSSILGTTALIFLDPVDSLGVGINNLFGKEIVKAGTGYVGVKDVVIGPNGQTESQIQLNVSFQLGEGKHYNKKSHKQINHYSDPVDTGIIGLSFGMAQTFLDANWHVDDGFVQDYSLGLYFSPAFSSRLSYAKNTLTDSLSGNDIAYENYGIDSQYYFNSASHLRPYLTAGFGEMMWQKDDNMKTFQVNAGAGIHYQLNHNFAFQIDWRHYYSTSTETSEDSLAARFIYRLGKGER